MKFYETHYEEYLKASEKFNIHPEMDSVYDNFPKDIQDLGNLIIYGPCGVGKYTQALKIMKKYSPTNLKYEKKIKIQTDKQTYTYRISDIHYEIDMGLLGCNSKILWNELFQQIVDIVAVKQEKKGFIVCKNFHLIHTELLEIFYSYIQQYNHSQSNLQIRFILLTEQVSFIPNNVLNSCLIVSIRRPEEKYYSHLSKLFSNSLGETEHCETLNLPIEPLKNIVINNNQEEQTSFINRINHIQAKIIQENQLLNTENNNSRDFIKETEPEFILNIKEIYSFSLIKEKNNVPKDIFNIICDNIIKEIENPNKIVFSNFRDIIYDILIYNLDVSECLWYILTHFIQNEKLKGKKISNILNKSYTFLKYFNNNYRPIYHLENIFYYMIIQMIQP